MSEAQLSEKTEKKTYSSPGLTRFGHVVELTKGDLVPGEDGGLVGTDPTS